jgi:DNA polymerase-1
MSTWAAFDLETTDLSAHKGEIFSYCITPPTGIVEVRRVDGKDGKDPEKAWARLQEFFDDTSIEKVAHNAKFEQSFVNKCPRLKIPRSTIWHDTMIQSQLLRNLAPGHGLDDLVWELGGDFGGEYKKLDKEIANYARTLKNYGKIPVPLMHRYQIADGERGALLHLLQFPHIKKDERLYRDYLNEMELIKVTERLEDYGITVDFRNCEKLLVWLDDEVTKVEMDTYKLLGEFINLNSAEQVSRILFNRLKYPVLKLTKNKNPSVDKDTVEMLRDVKETPFLNLLLKYRSYTAGRTMIRSYMEMADARGRIHTDIGTNAAQTGRETSRRPNAQNISKEFGPKKLFPIPARKCFRAPDNHVLYLADYAGIEMRLIVDACGEDELIKLINQNGDPHALAASLFYGPWCPPSQRWEEADKAARKILRTAAKNASFALAYGGAAPKLATVLSLPLDITLRGMEAYRERFPRVAGFTKSLVGEVMERGFIETSFGRKLFIPRDTPYVASNYKIQGTAAGILKRAQVAIDKYLQEEWDDQVRIVIPIHDELIFSYPRILFPQREIILPKIAKLMTTMPEIRVRLDTEWKLTTTTWADAKEIKLAA